MPDDIRRKLPDEVVDELLAEPGPRRRSSGPGGLLSQLTKRLVERALEVELTDHVGYERHQEPPGGAGNTRNGSTPKTLITEHGPVGIDTPRDRDGSFEPKIVRKRQRRFEGFDDKILALYSRGLSTRDIEAHIAEIYGVHVGRDLISRVTDAVMDDARAWQQRPLEDVYPVVFLDALVLKIRDGGSVQRRACYLAMAIGMDGERDVLGMWFQANEGAKFWMQVLTELKQRGVQDILICCVDGLKGFPEAIEAIFPQTTVQTCIVHLIRHSLKYVPRRAIRRRRQGPQADLHRDRRRRRPTVALEAFEEKWGAAVPRDRPGVARQLGARDPVHGLPAEVRRVIYTTNAIEALNRQLRKAVKTKGHFPSRTPPANCSTSRSTTPCRNGHEPGTGRKRCWRSRSTSETDCPTSHQKPPTQKTGHPPLPSPLTFIGRREQGPENRLEINGLRRQTSHLSPGFGDR